MASLVVEQIFYFYVVTFHFEDSVLVRLTFDDHIDFNIHVHVEKES